MTSTLERTWQDEMRDAMRISYKDKLRRLADERDSLTRLSNNAQMQLVSLSTKRNAKYRKAQYNVMQRNRELNQARDAYNELLDEDQVIADWQSHIIWAVGWYVSGVFICSWRDPKFVLRTDPGVGCLHIYFGGLDKPDGVRHGHIVLLSDGRIAYRRNPGKRHGPQNYRMPRLELAVPDYALQQ